MAFLKKLNNIYNALWRFVIDIAPKNLIKEYKLSNGLSYNDLKHSNKRLEGILTEVKYQKDEIEKDRKDLEEKLKEEEQENLNLSKIYRWQKHIIHEFRKSHLNYALKIFAMIKDTYKERYDCVIILDEDYTIQAADGKIRKVIGYTKDSIIGTCFSSLMTDEEERNIFSRGDYCRSSIDIRKKNGKIAHLKVKIKKLPQNDSPAYLFVYLRKPRFIRERLKIAKSKLIRKKSGYEEIIIPKELTEEFYRVLDGIKNKAIDAGKNEIPKVELNLENVRQNIPQSLKDKIAVLSICLKDNLRFKNVYKSDEIYTFLVEHLKIPKKNISPGYFR